MRQTKQQTLTETLVQNCQHRRLREALMGPSQVPSSGHIQAGPALERKSVSSDTTFYISFIAIAMLTLLCHSVVSIASM